MLDSRVSLWDINIREIRVGNVLYVLQKKPERGATCIVYPAMKQEKVGEEIYEHRVLLKEFYPILKADKSGEIRRLEDGTLNAAEYIRASEEYKLALKRFKNAYSIMLELANADEGAEFLSVPTSLAEDNGTWYLVEPYDSGTPFSELFGDEKRDLGVLEFLDIFCKCIEAVARLHSRGYYHLDLKPQNVSYTRGENIKLFDTDTFLKKDDLENFPTLLVTEGYSAPELRMADSAPENIPYWIGPWTDVYSLTQFICWYLYGRPLREDELEEQLEYLTEKTQEKCSYQISQKGIYRLKGFLRRNLSSDRKVRNQVLVQDMLEEVKQIRSFLHNRLDEPLDNFKESSEPVFGYDARLAELEELLIDAEYDHAAVTLAGNEKEKREALVRYYATLHRPDYSDIVEVRCDNFEGLFEKIGVLPPIENPHPKFPILFLIFDEGEKDYLSKKEAEEMNRLISTRNCQVLIVGKFNRCRKRIKNFDRDIYVFTIDMDDWQTEPENDEIGELIRQKRTALKESWKQVLGQCLFGILLVSAGWLIISLASYMADNCLYYNEAWQAYGMGPWWKVTASMMVHLLGSGMGILGLGMVLYLIFERVTPYGGKYFVREYSGLFMIGWAAVTALTLPELFKGFSQAALITSLDYEYVQVIEKCNVILPAMAELLWCLIVIMWLYRVVSAKRGWGILLKLAGWVLLILSCVCILLQTIENPWELPLLAGFILLTEWCMQHFCK